MTGSNRRPSACKADALPAELILHVRYYYLIFILINQSLFNFFLKNMYSLAASDSCGTSGQLPSALESLTAVFDMGTGVASPPSPPDYWLNDIHSKPDRSIEKSERTL